MLFVFSNCMFGLKRHGSYSKVSTVALLAVACIFCAFSSTSGFCKVALQAVASSNLKFTNSIYKILSQQQGNVFFSPLSIEMILALTYMGARGSTALQMASGLRLPDNDELIKRGFHALITSFKSDEHITLEFANKIFTDELFPFKKEFQIIARHAFVSDVESVDFKNNFETVRVKINQWVQSKTNNKIQNLLVPGSLSHKTKLLLLNAAYFKGDWAIKFDEGNTSTEPFFLTPTHTRDVQMMHLAENFGLAVSEDLDCQVLELPYKEEKLSFVVLLPNKLDGLAKLEAKLPDVHLRDLICGLKKSVVSVSLPKFKLEQSTDLNEVLQKLGMTDMANEDLANFSGLSEKHLFVSEVVHKAFIEVNEQGSEAAAATGVVVLEDYLEMDFQPPRIFKADHPFVFLLRDRETCSVLFMGKLAEV